MNWKRVSLLIVSAILVSACSATSQNSAAPVEPRSGQSMDGGGEGTAAPKTEPAAAAPGAPVDAAKKPIIVHE